MRPLLLAAATAAGFAVLPAPGALAQTACLYGGPDPAADLACGRSFVAQPAASAGSARAQGAASTRAPVTRSNGVAESRILSSGAAYAPAAPALPYGYEYEPRPDSVWAAPQPYAPQSYGPEPYAGAYGGAAYGYDAGAYGYGPDPYGQAYAQPYGPAPDPAYGQGGYAYGPAYEQGGYAYGPGPQYGPDHAYGYGAYGPSYDYAPPPAPPGLDGYAPSYVHVEGAGHAAPGTYAYAYQSADGEAYAWRYETPEGPVWAYGYETPEGWAWAYAYDDAPSYYAPPPAIEAHPMPPAHGHGHGYSHHGHHAPPPHADWRYSEERLYGASYPRLLYLVQTWRRESEWVTHHPPRGRGCGGCGGVIVQPAAYPAGHGGFYGGGGFGGGFSGGTGLSQSASFARSSQSASFQASQTSQAHAVAGPNQTVIAGTPFPPPAGAPVPPWGPPPMLAGGANAGAYAGAQGFGGR